MLGNLIDDEGTVKKVSGLAEGYDIIVANILPVVLEPLAVRIPGLLKPDGVYITSGILKETEAHMRAVHEAAGLCVKDVMYLGEWCCMISTLDL